MITFVWIAVAFVAGFLSSTLFERLVVRRRALRRRKINLNKMYGVIGQPVPQISTHVQGRPMDRALLLHLQEKADSGCYYVDTDDLDPRGPPIGGRLIVTLPAGIERRNASS